MKTKDYLPHQDTEFVVWLENFSKKLASHASTLRITPDEITQFQNDALTSTKKLNEVQNTKTTLQSLVKSKNDLFNIIKKRVRDKAVILKRTTNYNNSIGEDLGILPPETVLVKGVSIDSVKPEFTVTVLPDKVRLNWVKSEFDGIIIQSKRNNESLFTTLDKDTLSPYEDLRKNLTPDIHEQRIYRIRYLLKDEEVGQWSDELKVYCML